MKIAIISLPDINTPVQGTLNNLNGYWKNSELIAQWSGACKVKYDEDFCNRKKRVLESYRECMAQFYRDNAL